MSSSHRQRGMRSELALPPDTVPSTGAAVLTAANDNSDAPPRLYTIADAAPLLSVCERTLRREIARGRVRAVYIGSLVRVSEAELRRLASEGTGAPGRDAL